MSLIGALPFRPPMQLLMPLVPSAFFSSYIDHRYLAVPLVANVAVDTKLRCFLNKEEDSKSTSSTTPIVGLFGGSIKSTELLEFTISRWLAVLQRFVSDDVAWPRDECGCYCFCLCCYVGSVGEVVEWCIVVFVWWWFLGVVMVLVAAMFLRR